jgi:hypothetical protein
MTGTRFITRLAFAFGGGGLLLICLALDHSLFHRMVHEETDSRTGYAKVIAANVSHAIELDQVANLNSLLQAVLEQNSDICSIGITGPEGDYLAVTEDHPSLWGASVMGDRPKADSTIVSLKKKWGEVQLLLTPLGDPPF